MYICYVSISHYGECKHEIVMKCVHVEQLVVVYFVEDTIRYDSSSFKRDLPEHLKLSAIKIPI